MRHQISKEDFTNHKIETVLAYSSEDNKKLLLKIHVNKHSFEYFVEKKEVILDTFPSLDEAILMYNKI